MDVAPQGESRCVSDYVVQDGVKILVGRTWSDVSTVFTNGLHCIRRETVRAASQNAAASPDSPGNLRSWTLAFPETQDWRSGRTLASASEDGRLVRHHYAPMFATRTGEDYAFAPAGAVTNCIRIVTTTGTADLPDGQPGRSTFSVSYIDSRHGHVLRGETRLLSGSGPAAGLDGHPVLDWAVHLYDANHQRVKTVHPDGTSATTERGVCGLVKSETARDGTSTLYQYDGMLRRIRTLTASRLPLDGAPGLVAVTNVEAVAYDASGRVASRSTYPGGPDGAPLPGYAPLIRTWQWLPYQGPYFSTTQTESDERGRFRFTSESHGELLATAVDDWIGGSSVETFYRKDGSVLQTHDRLMAGDPAHYSSWEGQSDILSTYDTAVSPVGTMLSSNSVNDQLRGVIHADFLGRTEESAAPAFGGGLLVDHSAYDSQGRLSSSVSGHKATLLAGTFTETYSTTSYAYDDLGTLFRTVRTVDGDDNVSETHSWFENLVPAQWPASLSAHVGTTSAWWRCNASVSVIEGAAVTTAVSRVRMTGKSLACTAQSASVDLDGVVSLSTTSFDPATGLATQTSVRSDGEGCSVAESIGGRAVSSASTAGETVNFTYDAFGRAVSTTAASPSGRTMELRHGYDSAGQRVKDIEVCGELAFTNTYWYGGPDGRAVVKQISPMGSEVREDFFSGGIPMYVEGDTNPANYHYDGFRRLYCLVTCKGEDYTDWAPTYWSYDDATGLVASKTYPDNTVVRYDYTPAGQLAARTNANGSVSRFFYSPGGKLLEEDHPEAISATVNGASPIAVTNFYDGSRHVGSSIHAGNCVVLRQIVYAQNRDVVESVINSVVTNGVTNVVSRFDYAYDGAGRRTGRVEYSVSRRGCVHKSAGVCGCVSV